MTNLSNLSKMPNLLANAYIDNELWLILMYFEIILDSTLSEIRWKYVSIHSFFYIRILTVFYRHIALYTHNTQYIAVLNVLKTCLFHTFFRLYKLFRFFATETTFFNRLLFRFPLYSYFSQQLLDVPSFFAVFPLVFFLVITPVIVCQTPSSARCTYVYGQPCFSWWLDYIFSLYISYTWELVPISILVWHYWTLSHIFSQVLFARIIFIVSCRCPRGRHLSQYSSCIQFFFRFFDSNFYLNSFINAL